MQISIYKTEMAVGMSSVWLVKFILPVMYPNYRANYVLVSTFHVLLMGESILGSKFISWKYFIWFSSLDITQANKPKIHAPISSQE